MSSDATSIVEQAVAWHVRQDEMPTSEWSAFVAWLEETPEHAQVYDAVARQGRLLAEVRFALPVASRAANDDMPRRRLWWGAGVAAVAAALAVWVVPSGGERRFVTRDGERRAVTLADGTQIAMNGGTALVVERGDRGVRLDRGEIMARVVHNAASPFTVRAGEQVIQDVGTQFDVVRTDRSLAVAVAEGAVALRGAVPVRLGAGEALTIDIASGTAQRTVVTPASVGAWQSGVLSFDGAPLTDVVAALRRHEGLDVQLEGGLSQRPFTGMMRLTGIADRDIPHLADLIGATWRRDGKRWVLAEHSPAAR